MGPGADREGVRGGPGCERGGEGGRRGVEQGRRAAEMWAVIGKDGWGVDEAKGDWQEREVEGGGEEEGEWVEVEWRGAGACRRYSSQQPTS